MLLMEFSSLFCLIGFAHVTESRIYILRDYDDEPLFIDTDARGLHNNAEHSKLIKALTNTVKSKPKRTRNNKQAIIHYGRHIYHLDNFDELTKLRSELNPDYISYDYFDINDLVRSSDYIPWDYIQNLMDISPSPLRPCRGRQCKDHRKYSNAIKKHKHRQKYPEDHKENWKKNKLPSRTLKRFKIIDNRNKLKAIRKPKRQKVTYDSSEKYHGKRKLQAKHRHKKQFSSESTSASDSNESKDSNSESVEVWHIKKEKFDSDSKSTEESSELTERRKKKYKLISDLNSSEDNQSEVNFSNSIEDIPKKKRKKPTYGSSEEMRKKFEEPEELFLQGNKLFNTNNLPNSEEDRRRRLSQFLPKRFHWDPSDIHELGYYWFNGPKGRYPGPKTLS